MNWKKWISIAAAVCLAVTAVPMRAVAQEELLQEKMLEEIKEEQQEELKEEKEEPKEEKEEKEELKEEKEEKEEKEKLQEQSDEKIEPQEKSKEEPPEGISLLMEEENSTAVSENETADFEGEGTAANPYKIQNVDDLKLLAENVNNGEAYANTYFKLTANIDLNNEPNWTPIGTEDTLFQGTFDGGGHQITNLKIGKREYGGLFGNVWGATIQNCNVTGEVNGYNYSGGIVGYANDNTHILNCSFQGNVEGNGQDRGGIVGSTSIGCDVSGCFVTGTVTGGNCVGGIAGNGVGTIKNCYALADVTAAGDSAGGIAGYAYNLSIENCYYSGKVSSNGNAGGIAGIARNSEIQNCVSLAERVTGVWQVNRIAGGNHNATLTDNYAWDGTTVSGSAASDGADLTYTNGTLSPQFSEIFGSDNSAWKFTKDGLPILNDVGGTQFSELPKCMTGVGFDGFGIKTNPYLIEDVEDLKLLAKKVNSGETYEGKYFKQTANIDLENEPNWTPIGGTVIEHPSTWEISVFKGNYDGDGYKITNLTTTEDSNHVGLFGKVEDATIQNCNITGNVNGYNYVGGIVGGVGVKTKILNCSFQGSVMGESDCVGGIVGETSAECEVSGCFARGKVEGLQKVGGIAGKGVGTIKNCYALADVTAKSDFSPNTNEAGNYAGGIAGDVFYCTIENCYYSGKVSAKDYAGGIAGYVSGAKTIRNCVSLAESVTGIGFVNRIAGQVIGNTSLINNHSYNRTQLVINGEITYPTGGAGNDVIGADVYISNGRVMTDVQKGEVFNWNKNGFTEKNGWSIPNEAYKLPSLHGGEYPDLPNLPSKDLTIDKTPQHFTTRNIGNGFVVKVTSEGTLNESIEFTKEYRLHDTTGEWMSAVPNTAGTYDVKITRAADGDINPFACEIFEGLVLTKKRSSSSGAATQTYTAQFDTNGGSAVDKVKTDKNGKIERPADPTKEGYIFVGWYSDSKLTKPFDFSAELTANSTLYAKWKENNEIILTIGSRKISVFGREIKNDVAPKIVNDRTMLPIRIVAESLGGTVTWNGELQRVTIQKGADVILITIGADTAYVNGTAVKLDAAAFVENGRTYLPLRFVSETLGAQVAWNEAEKTVTITK